MKRLAAISLLTIFVSCVTPAQVTESDSVASVAGTAWAGIVNASDSAGRFQDYAYEFEFLAGNRVRWRWRGTIYVNGSWQQNGNEILLELNDSSSTWRGTIEGNRMSGSSFNKEGYRWDWVLIRQTQALPQSAQIIPPPGEWIQYSSPAGRFQVLLPTEPRVTEQALNVGSVKLPNNVFLSLTQLAVFGVSYADFPTNTWKAKTLLEKVRKGVIAGINGTLIRSSNISHKGYPGNEFQASSDSGLYTSRIFLVNGRLYQLVVAASGKDSNADVQRFLNSFDLK